MRHDATRLCKTKKDICQKLSVSHFVNKTSKTREEIRLEISSDRLDHVSSRYNAWGEKAGVKEIQNYIRKMIVKDAKGLTGEDRY